MRRYQQFRVPVRRPLPRPGPGSSPSLELGFVLPRVVEVIVLGRHGVVVVVDHIARERAANCFLADGLDVRQGLADARALRRGGSGGDDAAFSRAERPGRRLGAYLPLELVLQARQRGCLVRRHGCAAETPRAHRGARQRKHHRRERQHGRARPGLGSRRNGTDTGTLPEISSKGEPRLGCQGWFRFYHKHPRVAAMAYQQMRDAGAQYRKGGDPFARPAFDSYETQYDPGYDTLGYQQGGMRPPQSQQVRRLFSSLYVGTGCRS